jgi:hypothetical protein
MGIAMSDSDNPVQKESPLKLFIPSENRPRSLEGYIRDAWAVARVLEAWAALEASPAPPEDEKTEDGCRCS